VPAVTLGSQTLRVPTGGTVPTYAYACTACEHRFEIVQSFVDDSLTECPECAGRLRKLFNAVGVVFKGSGFYRTDSRNETRKGSAGGSSSGSSSTSSDSSKAGTTKTASKSESSDTSSKTASTSQGSAA
jgi:putative FmdB family regulatory protein